LLRHPNFLEAIIVDHLFLSVLYDEIGNQIVVILALRLKTLRVVIFLAQHTKFIIGFSQDGETYFIENSLSPWLPSLLFLNFHGLSCPQNLF
jgi:hypothetical protein